MEWAGLDAEASQAISALTFGFQLEMKCGSHCPSLSHEHNNPGGSESPKELFFLNGRRHKHCGYACWDGAWL